MCSLFKLRHIEEGGKWRATLLNMYKGVFTLPTPGTYPTHSKDTPKATSSLDPSIMVITHKTILKITPNQTCEIEWIGRFIG